MKKIHHTLKMNPGDILLIAGDGLPELLNARQEILGDHRIRNVLVDQAEEDSSGMPEALKGAADKWRNGTEQLDDMTIIIVRARPDEPV